MKNRTFKLRDETTLFEMMRMYTNVSQLFQPIYDEQTELYDFTVAALQWDKRIRSELRQARRPANSYNLIRTIFNVIYSVEEDNRKTTMTKPRTVGDNDLNDKISQTLAYYFYRAGFRRAQNRVFRDSITARLGVYHLGWRYDGTEDDQGSLFINAADPREFGFEPYFDDPLWEKTGFLFRKHGKSLEEILNTFALDDDDMLDMIMGEASMFFQQTDQKGKWISKRLKALFAAAYETVTGYSSQTDNVFKNYLQWWDPLTGRFDVLELHEKRTERRIVIPDRRRKKLVDITDAYHSTYRKLNSREPDSYKFENELINKIKEKFMIDGNAKTELKPRRYMTAVIPAFNIKVSENVYPVDSKYYTYIPEYCYDEHADPLKVQSIMDDLKDPQADFNKAKSLILELLGRYANKGWVMDENAISGVEEDWYNNRIAPYKRVRAGYINMIRPETGQTISPELIRMPMETQGLMKIITNADDEIRGSRSPGVTSGKHFIAKEQRQAKSFTRILKNRDDSHHAVAELAMDFIQHFVSTQTILRITTDMIPGLQEDKVVHLNQRAFTVDEDGKIAEKIINDVDAYKYDVIVSDEPYSGTALEDKYYKLGQLFNAAESVNPKKADAMLPIMVRVGGFSEANDILKAWQAAETPSPEQQQLQKIMTQIQLIMAKLGVEAQQLENKKTAAEIENEKADTEKKQQEADAIPLDKATSILGELNKNQNNGNGKSKTKAA